MRISDLSSDVCSSDLREIEEFLHAMRQEQQPRDDAQQRIGLLAETIQKFHKLSPPVPKDSAMLRLARRLSSRHCERSEAIQCGLRGLWIASLPQRGSLS